MNSSTRCGPLFRFGAALLLAVIGWVSAIRLGADETTLSPPPYPVPFVTSDVAVQKALIDLDRTLESNAKLDQILRSNIDRLSDEDFRTNNPEVATLLTQKPEIVDALRIERHFLIHRYIAHIARDEFLALHRDIRKDLERDPSKILEDNFLIANPSLADFFGQHPSLSSILLERRGDRPVPAKN